MDVVLGQHHKIVEMQPPDRWRRLMMGQTVDKHIHKHGFATANPTIDIHPLHGLGRAYEFFDPVLRLGPTQLVNQIIKTSGRDHLCLIFGQISSGNLCS